MKVLKTFRPPGWLRWCAAVGLSLPFIYGAISFHLVPVLAGCVLLLVLLTTSTAAVDLLEDHTLVFRTFFKEQIRVRVEDILEIHRDWRLTHLVHRSGSFPVSLVFAENEALMREIREINPSVVFKGFEKKSRWGTGESDALILKFMVCYLVVALLILGTVYLLFLKD